MTEEDGESGVLDVTHHEQRDEDQARQHGDRKQKALLGRLQTSTGSFRKDSREAQNVKRQSSSGLTHWTRDGAPRPAKSMVLKTMKQQTQVNTLSVNHKSDVSEFPVRTMTLMLVTIQKLAIKKMWI